ncbi:MAG TPA: hypothetical protein VHI14_09705 [Jatrophihabitantaceae bacterium]|nr:hypothetical protein [Jatrophihabitantaceae bacterium]
MRPTAPHQRQRLWVLPTLFVALAVAVVGCTQTVSGHGTASNPPSSSPNSGSDTSSSEPSTSSSASAPNDVACPVVVDNLAKLSYPCIVNTMTTLRDPTGIWQTQVALPVEPQWYMNEGSRSLTETSGVSLSTINTTVMTAMKANEFWGANAKATTKASKAMTIDGHQARLLQTLMTVSPTVRQQRHLKVKTEMVWLVAIRVTDTTSAAFFCSVPDDVKKYWPLVPRIITQVKVAA